MEVRKVKRKRKLYSNNVNLIRESAKVKRVKGEEYVNRSGNTVGLSGKKFRFVADCCGEQCYSSFTPNHQEELFSSFYNQGKELQDSFRSKCMAKTDLKTQTIQPKKARLNTWAYSLNVGGFNFFCLSRFLKRPTTS